jgi:superfamily II DNA or RNA helicase
METIYKPGALVSLHDREWVVQPSKAENVLLLKPLGGTDREIKGIVKSLAWQLELVQPARFELPQIADIGPFSSARILCDAARLSFRSGAGPFRSMGRLAFSPRPYQLVPLVMALKLPTARLLIADDVGVGKTIEALLIVRELLDRGEIKRFAIVCLPHLCDQWQQELKDKFGIDAVLIRSGTVKRLERDLGPDEPLFTRYPYQVISIDYIKSDKNRNVFLNHVPEMIVVDEAHTCAQPGKGKNNQQQRHNLIKAIANNPEQHLLLLTATPHSGKQEEFQSLLGLLNPQFAEVNLIEASKKHKAEVARHFVQRRRKNILHWMDEETRFPKRLALERAYPLSKNYLSVFKEVLRFARSLAVNQDASNPLHNGLRYYLAIGLLRGVMSSPATGEAMLQRRMDKQALDNEEDEVSISNHSILDGDFDQHEDQAPTELADRASFSSSEQKSIRKLTNAVAKLRGFEHDHKAAATRDVLAEWLKTDNTIVFCRYIQTAKYLGELLKPVLTKLVGKKVNVEVITSELSDEERKEKVTEISADKDARKLIIATDCMSEGINLQEHFSAVIHYDLPWNPNRLEQREGRVDRYGQDQDEVKALLLYGENNPMDGTVLQVLLRKARKIRQAIGISVPFPDDSKSIMDAVLTAVLLSPTKGEDESVQAQLDFGDEDAIRIEERKVEEAYERMEEQEKQITSIFAQKAIKPAELTPYLFETEVALGSQKTVFGLLRTGLPLFGTKLEKTAEGFRLIKTNLPIALKELLPGDQKCLLSFESPTPSGYTYVGRNHPFVENICLQLLEGALLEGQHINVSRVSVFRSKDVTERTTLYLLRIRNVIADKDDRKELVAEEVKLWGFSGLVSLLAPEVELIQQLDMLWTISPSQEVPLKEKKEQLVLALEDYGNLKKRMDDLAQQRSDHMRDGHEQFRKVVNGDHYKTVVPVLPPDVLGVYVILPEISQ